VVTKLHDLLCRGEMRRRTAGTHRDTGLLELLADCAPMNAQLGTDLAQSPALGVQVGCTLNIHERRHNESGQDGFRESGCFAGARSRTPPSWSVCSAGDWPEVRQPTG
jgi:hypothetical protein